MKVFEILLEIAPKGEGNYASARSINAKLAKMGKCSSCDTKISMDHAYMIGGRPVCKQCKTEQKH